jgi:hypothetical protein
MRRIIRLVLLTIRRDTESNSRDQDVLYSLNHFRFPRYNCLSFEEVTARSICIWKFVQERQHCDIEYYLIVLALDIGFMIRQQTKYLKTRLTLSNRHISFNETNIDV